VPERPRSNARPTTTARPANGRQRETSTARGYDRRWREARLSHLAEQPLCVACQRADPPRVEPATVVDHVVPHRGDQGLFWDRDNWQSLCKRCHDQKTAAGE
jgi:5-methylcytosine-specific restriction enzyme A